jgi:hypothetical protein
LSTGTGPVERAFMDDRVIGCEETSSGRIELRQPALGRRELPASPQHHEALIQQAREEQVPLLTPA